MKITSSYMRASVIIPAIILLVLITYLLTALQMNMPIVNGSLTESFFPTLISILGIISSGKLLWAGLEESHLAAKSFSAYTIKFSVKPLLIILITGLFIAFFEILGFAIVTPLYVFLFMLIYDDKIQKIPSKICYALIISAASFVLYELIFNIRFPEIWR